MGFLDNLRDRFQQNRGDEYYDDQDYDDGYYDDEPEENSSEHVGLLGNSRRPEPESVSVYTRSGRPVAGGAPAQTAPGYGDYRSEERSAVTPRPRRSYDEDSYAAPASRDYGTDASGATSNVTPGDLGGRTIARPSSSVLPPYVLKPAAYDDVQMVVRRVRTNQPVVLVFRNTNIEAAKRILDFCFGLACGLGGAVQELGDRIFVVLPAGIEFSDSDIEKLVNDGDLVK